jgi:hypothetical protein
VHINGLVYLHVRRFVGVRLHTPRPGGAARRGSRHCIASVADALQFATRPMIALQQIAHPMACVLARASLPAASGLPSGCDTRRSERQNSAQREEPVLPNTAKQPARMTAATGFLRCAMKINIRIDIYIDTFCEID